MSASPDDPQTQGADYRPDRSRDSAGPTTRGPSVEQLDESNSPAPPPSDELLLAQRQRDEYFDQLQRTRAEFANFQKRSRAQAESERAYAPAPIALDLVGVLDNFERAIEAARASGASSIVEGLDIVYRQFLAALAKHGVEPIPALGHPFDPNQHEALYQQPHPDHPEGTVVAELGKGYRLKDRVLRPTKVAVSSRPAE